MRFIKVLPLLFTAQLSFGQFTELKTKQSIKNIRHISSDGKRTFFINKKGEFKSSKNYRIKSLIKGEEYDNFLVFPSDDKKYLAIERIKNPHRYPGPIKNNHIYIGKTDSDKFEIKAKGVNPKVYFNGGYLTYFDIEKREINLQNLKTANKNVKIKLKNPLNPLYKPNIILIDPYHMLYTDINSKGEVALLLYETVENKFQTIYKAQSAGQKLQFCLKDGYVYIGDFSYLGKGINSQITKIKVFNNENFSNSKIIYTAILNDIGNLVCSDKNMFFIKSTQYNSVLNTLTTDVAQLSFQNEELELITDFGDITQIFKLGPYLLSKYKGKYLIIKGPKQTLDDSIEKGRL